MASTTTCAAYNTRSAFHANCMGKTHKIQHNLLFHVRFQIDWTDKKRVICSMTPSADTHTNTMAHSFTVCQSVSHSLSRKWFDVLIFNCLVKVDVFVHRSLVCFVHISKWSNRSKYVGLNSLTICWWKNFPLPHAKQNHAHDDLARLRSLFWIQMKNTSFPPNEIEFIRALFSTEQFCDRDLCRLDRSVCWWVVFVLTKHKYISASGKAIDTHMIKYLIFWLPFFYRCLEFPLGTMPSLLLSPFISLLFIFTKLTKTMISYY